MIGTKILEERKSKYNGNIRVVNTWGMGTYIQSNGLTQSGGIVETIWRSTLRKIRNSNIEIRNVLILGLGGGTVAKLIRKNWPDAKITGVDIDPIMIELGKKYLGLESVKIIIGDASKYTTYDIPNTKYDLVIVDLYNGDQFPKKFEEEKFLKNLAKNKLVIFNRLSFKGKKEEAMQFGKKLEKIFTKVEVFYPVSNVMYVCT